jgi:hypothetical protein
MRKRLFGVMGGSAWLGVVTRGLQCARRQDHRSRASQEFSTSVCRHDENTDLTRWTGAIYVFCRTAGSEVLDPPAPCASSLAECRREL